jgi:hypothetical protein
MPDKIQGGYILLARKMLESEIMDKPPLYFKLWGWMLLQAKFKPQKGLARGQFKTSIKEMQTAMAHLVGYRKVTPTAKQIRGVYESLTKGHMIDTMKVTGGLIVTILKYDEYQDYRNYEGHDEGAHEGKVEGTSYNNERKRMNVNLSSGKSALDFFAPEVNGWDKTNVQKTIDGLISLRKTKQISAGVLESEFEYWGDYPDEIINKALSVYVNGKYWEKSKGEKYLRGIIRGKNKEAEKSKNNPMFKRAF